MFQTSGGAPGITQFLYDGDELVAEYNSAGTLLRRYVHSTADDDPVAWCEGASIGTSRRFIQPDYQGSVVSVADNAGTSLLTNTYDPWGVPGAANAGRFQYTGQTWIPELGMYYYKARFYSPTLGRFLQVDPIGYKDQVNLYAYVANDPANRIDPTGLCIRGGDDFGCSVNGASAGTPQQGVPVIRADDAAAINGHAISGDGSARQADFTKVSIAGLGKVIYSYANQSGSQLNNAIMSSRDSGKPVQVSITSMSAGGEIGGRSPRSQQLGIGRFAVDISGTVTATKTGQWNLNGRVTGNTDVQDYGSDSRRGSAGSAGTAAGNVLQNIGGGKDYNVTFFGSQNINVDGRWVNIPK